MIKLISTLQLMGNQDPEQRPECKNVLGDYHWWGVNKNRLQKSERFDEVLENLKKEPDHFLDHLFWSNYKEDIISGILKYFSTR